MERTLENYINGTLSESNNYMYSFSYNEKIMSRVGIVDDQEVVEALYGNQKYLEEGKVSVEKVYDIAYTLAELISIRFKTLTRILSQETGYTIKDSEGLLSTSKEFLFSLRDYYAEYKSHQIKHNTKMSYLDKHYSRRSYITTEPKGVVLCILPANASVPLILIQAFSALLAGSAVTFITSSRNVNITLLIAQLLNTLDLPAGAINVLNCNKESALPRAIESGYVDSIYYTGSSKYANTIIDSCKEHSIDFLTEVEGNGIVIVEDLPNETAIDSLVASITRCNGQLCTSVNGILVSSGKFIDVKKKIQRKLSQQAVGDPLDRINDIGPIISNSQAMTIKRHLREATLSTDNTLSGIVDGKYVRPTLVSIESFSLNIVKQETFGPVAWIASYEQDKDIKKFLDRYDYGLNISVFSNKPERLLETLFTKCKVARICVNSDPTIQSPFFHWGSYNKSGYSNVSSYISKFERNIIVEKEHSNQNMENKSLILSGPNKLTLKELPIPNHQNGHIKVRMLFSGICGTDKSVIQGKMEAPYPLILGHENVGVIESIPSKLEGKGYEKGDPVTWPSIIPCGSCKYCNLGLENLCSRNRIFGLTYTSNTEPYAFGGWSKYCFLPVNTPLFKLNSLDLRSNRNAVLVDPLSTSIAIKDMLKKHKGRTPIKNVLINGSGIIGLMTCIVLKHLINNVEITLSGYHNQANIINLYIDNLIPPIKNEELTIESLNPDIIVNAVPGNICITKGLEVIRPGGIIIDVGNVGEVKAEISLSELIMKDVRILGKIAYSMEQFSRSLDFLVQHEKILEPLITSEFSIEDHSNAINAAYSRDEVKVVFALNKKKGEKKCE